jgi:hypothetical protein
MPPYDLDVLPAPAGAGPALVAAELLARTIEELPVVGRLDGQEQLLVAAWLAGLRSPRTRRAYAADLVAWLGQRQMDALGVGRVHVDMWAAGQLGDAAAAVSVRRRLSALSSFRSADPSSPGMAGSSSLVLMIGRVLARGLARPSYSTRPPKHDPAPPDNMVITLNMSPVPPGSQGRRCLPAARCCQATGWVPWRPSDRTHAASPATR